MEKKSWVEGRAWEGEGFERGGSERGRGGR